jgi:hypothetical protein
MKTHDEMNKENGIAETYKKIDATNDPAERINWYNEIIKLTEELPDKSKLSQKLKAYPLMLEEYSYLLGEQNESKQWKYAAATAGDMLDRLENYIGILNSAKDKKVIDKQKLLQVELYYKRGYYHYLSGSNGWGQAESAYTKAIKLMDESISLNGFNLNDYPELPDIATGLIKAMNEQKKDTSLTVSELIHKYGDTLQHYPEWQWAIKENKENNNVA